MNLPGCQVDCYLFVGCRNVDNSFLLPVHPHRRLKRSIPFGKSMLSKHPDLAHRLQDNILDSSWLQWTRCNQPPPKLLPPPRLHNQGTCIDTDTWIAGNVTAFILVRGNNREIRLCFLQFIWKCFISVFINWTAGHEEGPFAFAPCWCCDAESVGESYYHSGRLF